MLPIEAAISAPLKAARFRKKARTWHRINDGTIDVFNIQKSPYGDGLYLNLGVYLTSLGPELSPPEYRCHIQVRLEHVAHPSRVDEIHRAVAGADPPQPLLDAILFDAIAWFESVSTYAGIRTFIASGGARKALVFAAVRELLSADG